MTDNVVHLDPSSVGEGVHIDADQILRENVGRFQQVVLAAWDRANNLVVCRSDTCAESVLLLEQAKHFLITENLDD